MGQKQAVGRHTSVENHRLGASFLLAGAGIIIPAQSDSTGLLPVCILSFLPFKRKERKEKESERKASWMWSPCDAPAGFHKLREETEQSLSLPAGQGLGALPEESPRRQLKEGRPTEVLGSLSSPAYLDPEFPSSSSIAQANTASQTTTQGHG